MNSSLEYRTQGFAQIVEVLGKIGVAEGRLYILDEDERETLDWQKNGFDPLYLPHSEEEWSRAFADAYEDKGCKGFVVRDLTLLQDPDGFFLRLNGACSKLEVPLVVCCPNMAYKNQTFGLIAGELKGEKVAGRSFGYTRKTFEDWILEKNFLQLAGSDYGLDSPLQYGELENTLTQPGALANQYMDWLGGHFESGADCPLFIRGYKALPVINKEKKGKAEGIKSSAIAVSSEFDQPEGKKPFLTVITRTQGKRIGELREVLLCLTAQTDTDFELLVIGHKVSKKNREEVEKLIGETPPSLRNRIRYLALDTGNRSAPLNLGFEKANGIYVAVLDDDDLVTDDWVEVFHEIYNQKPGSILHAYSVSQTWERVELEEGLRARTRPSAKYCKPFQYARQLRTNYCPLMSLAFPAWLYKNSNIRFDETLDTTEDWDFLMRTALVAGVVDSERVTSIYRLWYNASSSAVLHTVDEWDDNRHYVNRKLNKMPLLLPPGSANELLRLYKESEESQDIGYRAVLFWDDGSGYSEAHSIETDNLAKRPDFEYTFHLLPKEKHTGYLRFDPEIAGKIMVGDFSATIYSQDGREIEIQAEDCVSNGFLVEGKMVFPLYNPMIFIPVPDGFVVDDLVARGTLYTSIPDEIYLPMLKRLGKQAVLFGDDGTGYKEENTIKRPISATQKTFKHTFTLPEDNQYQNELRFDPVENGGILVKNFTAVLTANDGQKLVLTQDRCRCNGVLVEDAFVFVKHDPQIFIPIPAGFKLDTVEVEGGISEELGDELLDGFIRRCPAEEAGEAVLYGDGGSGYSEEHIYITENRGVLPGFQYEYDLAGTAFKGKLRFDPVAQGGVMVEGLEAIITTVEGQKITVLQNQCKGNGYVVGPQLVFIKDDPQIHIPIPEGVVPVRLSISGNLNSKIPDSVIDHVVSGPLVTFMKRVVRKLKG